jgi:hypothetical protein
MRFFRLLFLNGFECCADSFLYFKINAALIKKKIEFSSYIRKFRMEQNMTNSLLIYGEIFAHFLIQYIRKPFLIYDFATAPL